MAKKHTRTVGDRIERPVPLVTQVEQALRRAIDEGAFPDGKLPTEVELADRFGVSRETVRRSTEVLQAEGLLRKMRRRGTVLAREVRPVQWTAASGPARLVAYVQAEYRGSDGEDEAAPAGVGGAMLQGVVQAAAAVEWDVIVRASAPARLRQTVEAITARHPVQGVIAASFAEDKALRRLGGRVLPIVLLDHDMPVPRVSSLRDDSAVGSRLAVEHLVALGHRHIAYVNWQRAELNPWRLRGYRDAMRAAHLAVRRTHELAAELTPRGARQAAGRLLDLSPRPTAAVCFNNTLARLLIDDLRRRGIRVGEAMSIVGCGGEQVHDLACSQIDWFALGGQSLAMLLKRVEDGQSSAAIEHVQAVPRLMTGLTAGPPAAK